MTVSGTRRVPASLSQTGTSFLETLLSHENNSSYAALSITLAPYFQSLSKDLFTTEM
jgi:hypothetical protein